MKKINKNNKKNKNIKPVNPKKYHQLPWFERSLDLLLMAGFIFGLMIVVLDLFFSLNKRFSTFIYVFDIIFVGIIFLDLGRTFLKSKNIWLFFKHHWLDVVILIFCIVAFSSVLYAGLGRFSWLFREEKVVMEVKELLPLSLLRKIKY